MNVHLTPDSNTSILSENIFPICFIMDSGLLVYQKSPSLLGSLASIVSTAKNISLLFLSLFLSYLCYHPCQTPIQIPHLGQPCQSESETA